MARKYLSGKGGMEKGIQRIGLTEKVGNKTGCKNYKYYVA